MHVILLTHSREFTKNSGTGQLVKEVLQGRCERICWARKDPDPSLLATIEKGKCLLLYPDQSTAINYIEWPQEEFETLIILDGTWQEAKKIYNRSPYLQNLLSYKLDVDYPSRYQLRRNQKMEGLCTAEVVMEILERQQHQEELSNLAALFDLHNQK